MTTQNAPRALVTWNGTNDRVDAIHATPAEAETRRQQNWRLYIALVPAGKYKVGDRIENDDLLSAYHFSEPPGWT